MVSRRDYRNAFSPPEGVVTGSCADGKGLSETVGLSCKTTGTHRVNAVADTATTPEHLFFNYQQRFAIKFGSMFNKATASTSNLVAPTNTFIELGKPKAH